MKAFEQVVFGKKTFGDILKEIYDNQKIRSKQVNELIETLKESIDDNSQIDIYLPHIKGYLDVGVKNDDNLIKAVGIIQRVITGGNTSEDFNLSDKEKEELLQLSKNHSEKE